MKTVITIHHFLWSLVITGMILTSCHTRTIRGSGHVTSETRPITGFTSVDVSAALTVIYTEGTEYKVEVEADDNLIGYIQTELSGNTLHIGIKNGKNFKHITKAEIHITAPSIQNIAASGASTFTSTSVIHGSNLAVNLSGASSASLSIQESHVSGDISGASSITINGSSESATLEASGASVYHAANFTCNTAAINFSGASSGDIQVQSSLVAVLSGASVLNYYGSPTVDVESSGASSLHKK